MLSRPLILFAVLLGTAPLTAQSGNPPSFSMSETEVRTFPLRHLRSKDAAQLIAPYAIPGMVFDAGSSVQAITVRDTPANLARIDSILRAYDLPPQTVALRFQVIASTTTATTDARMQAIEPSLRQLFSFAGYRLVGEGTTVVGESGDYQLTLAGDGRVFTIRGDVGPITRGDTPAVRMAIAMTGAAPSISDSAKAAGMLASMFGSMISTELTLPLGSLAVLGSGTEGVGDGVLILVVRPELRGGAGRP
jgi:hypothetical protein